MRSMFLSGGVLAKKLLIDLHVGLPDDFIVGDRWKMTDVKERPLDGFQRKVWLNCCSAERRVTCRVL